MKSTPKDATLASHKLLYQAGFIRESVAGHYYFLPLGWRVHQKIQQIVKKHMDASGAQEIISPVLHPKYLWEETNRTTSVGFELMTIKDRSEMEFVLGGTGEEMLVDLVRKFQISYKDLPFNLYQISSKFRDEARARGGLLRVREFFMKDAYSFDANEEAFKKEYQKMWDLYTTIFKEMGLETVVVESDNGYIGGEYCHEFVVVSDAGESKFYVTEDGTYAAHEDVAKFKRDEKNVTDKEEVMKEVDAMRGTTMEDGIKLHGLPMWQQMKDFMMVDENGRMILAVVRGDFDVNETKVLHVAKAYQLRHATDDEIRNIGSEPGFISPVGLKEKAQKKGIELLIIGDTSLRTVKNMYTGANEMHKDLTNVNIDRDYTVDVEADIALAREGDVAENGGVLQTRKGVEVGNIFQLGFHYTSRMKDATYTDENGEKQPYYMGCYGIGLGRTLATIVEVSHDDKGIIWPASVAPYDVHVIMIGSHKEVLTPLVEKLEQAGLEVLFDDREDVSPGERFADADLLGMPVRLIISDKSIEKGGIEVKERAADGSEIVHPDVVLDKVMQILGKK